MRKKTLITILSLCFALPLVPVIEPPSIVRNPTVVEAIQPPGDPIVWITNTGECYHTWSCRTLRASRIPVSLAEARLDFSPCSLCRPPGFQQTHASPPPSRSPSAAQRSS